MRITNKDGITFEISKEDHTVTIIKSPTAKAALLIPRTLSHQSQEYIITSIKDRSFKNNKTIRNIEFSTDSLLYSICNEAFSHSSLESIKIPAKLTEIGYSTFSWCSKLKTIEIPTNSSLCEIDKEAFSHSSIETFSMPSKVTEIKEFTFSHCDNLKTIEITENSSLHTIGKFAFSCSSLEDIFIPQNVERLEEGWCADVNNLNHFSVSLKNELFSNYEDKFIVGKTDKNKKEYEEIIFSIRNIEEATIPANIRTINSYSFSCCNNLRTMNFPSNSSLCRICKEAFSFSSIERIKIPSKTTIIEDGAFSYCKSLKTVEITDDSSLSSIDKETFSSSSIESLFIPPKVTTIKEGAFSYCENLKTIKITENSSLRMISKFAFSHSSLEDIFIPQNVERLEEGWCADVNNLNHFSVSLKNELFSNYEDKFIVGKTDKNKKEYEEIIFSIRNIEEATIPANIRTINSYSFSCCNNLRTMNFPSNSSLCRIEDFAFSSSSLEFISIPSQVKEIGENAFSNCYNLETVSFTDDSLLHMINKDVFAHSSVEYITISSKVTKIAEHAFLECKRLKAIYFAVNSSLNYIHKEAFSGCSIETLSFPSSLMKILAEVIKYKKITNIEIIDEEVHINSSFKMSCITSISCPKAQQVIIDKGCGKFSLLIQRDCKIIADESTIKEHEIKLIIPRKEIKIEIMNDETIERLIQNNEPISETPTSTIYKIKLNNENGNKKGSKNVKKGKKTKKTKDAKKVKNSTKEVRALKVFNIQMLTKDEDNNETDNSNYYQIDTEKMEKLVSKLDILNKIDHQNIIKTFGFFFGDENHQPCVLEEYFKSNLENSIKQLKEVDLVAIIYEISSAMKEVHRKRIMHCNLKPANILLDMRNHVKICDFNIFKMNDSQEQPQMNASKSSLLFAAPEIENNEHYDEKADVYSFGLLVVFILSRGELPDDSSLEKKATIPKSLNKISHLLIERCLSSSPRDRPSFFQIVDFIIKSQFKLIDGIENELETLRKFLGFTKDEFLPTS